jgi:aminopeptidase N
LLTGCAGPGAIGSLGGSSGADVDLLRIDAELSIDADRRLLGVEALYRFQVERAGLRQLEFVYGGPALESVLDGEGRLVPFQQEGERLTLELEEPGEYGSELLLQFSYYGRPRLDFGFAAAGNGESAGYCLGQAEARGPVGWLPCPTDPEERAELGLRFDLPAGWVALAPGRRAVEVAPDARRNAERWVSDQASPLAWLHFAAGPFVEREASAGNVGLRYLCLPELETWLEDSLAETPELLGFLANYFDAPFPASGYTQLCLPVQSPLSLPGATILPETVLVDERARRDEDPSLTLVASAARQWLAAGLRPEPGHRFLDEGLAGYVALRYAEGTRAPDRAAGLWREARLVGLGEDQSLIGLSAEAPTVSWVPRAIGRLRLLEQQVGREAFDNGLADYVRANAGRAVSAEDLQAALEIAAGRDLAPLFLDWFSQSGDPRLDLDWDYEPGTKQLTYSLRQLRSLGGRARQYRAAVEIEVHSGAWVQRFPLDITSDRVRQSFTLPGPPDWVRFDPDGGYPCERTAGSAGAPPLAQASRDVDPMGRVEAIEELGRRLDRGDAGALRDSYLSKISDRALRDPSAEVRLAAVRVLAAQNTRTASLRLRQVAGADRDLHVRAAALEALEPFGPDRDLADLAEAEFAERASWRCMAAAAGLRTAAAPQDAALWLTDRLVLESPAQRLRAALLGELGNLEGRDSEELLLGWARNASAGAQVRAAAIEALGRLRPRAGEVGAALVEILGEPDGGPLVRATVLDALAGRSDSNSRRALQFWNARGAGSASLEDAVYAPVDGD